MYYRFLSMLLIALLLSGCQWATQQGQSFYRNDTSCCDNLPVLANNDAALNDWVAFGRAVQREDQAWRNDKLQQIDMYGNESRLAQALLLAWGPESQWRKASELYETGISLAPPKLEPLFRYWMAELERRRELLGRLSQSEHQRRQLSASNAQHAAQLEKMTEKLDALTDIEKNINLRQP